VICFAEQGTLFLIFRDDGVEYNPLDTKEADIGASAEEREIGGLGVMIVRKLMDDVIYERKDNWNQLTMTLKIQ
jgi:anti-sigma regulatory factor (Ser/Thr protein kinase)